MRSTAKRKPLLRFRICRRSRSGGRQKVRRFSLGRTDCASFDLRTRLHSRGACLDYSTTATSRTTRAAPATSSPAATSGSTTCLLTLLGVSHIARRYSDSVSPAGRAGQRARWPAEVGGCGRPESIRGYRYCSRRRAGSASSRLRARARFALRPFARCPRARSGRTNAAADWWLRIECFASSGGASPRGGQLSTTARPFDLSVDIHHADSIRGREARAVYGVETVVTAARGQARAGVQWPPDVARLLERASRADDFNRGGRHAAAERMLREVMGGLARRRAFEPAATTALVLGRMLLERGRATGAECAFDEAAQYAQSADVESVLLDARLWQATARIDAARLTDAESVARAVLMASTQAPTRQAWAHAVLARVLVWQGRIEEAVTSHLPSPQSGTGAGDPVVAASSDATAVRTLLAAGKLFQAGLRARTLVVATEESADPLTRLIAATAHLRVLAAAGDRRWRNSA